LGALKENIPVRSYKGECWITNGSNKKRLAIDFENKCAYCDDHQHYSGGYNAYHVEHFAPKEKFKHLEFVYDNLLYSCPYCNTAKSNKWIGSDEFENIIGNKGFIDPCSEEYNNHLQRNADGSIGFVTELGEYIYKELKLYLKRHQLIYNLEKVRVKKKQLRAKIDEMEKVGQKTDELADFYNQLCVVFCEYFDLFFEDEN
jgi:uncharacterized protein (TIGR02646 family)